MNENAMPSPEGAGVAWFLKIDEWMERAALKSLVGEYCPYFSM
jgi:hypothetical protein